MVWATRFLKVVITYALYLNLVEGNMESFEKKTDDLCPCLRMDKCPRVFGQSATDIRELGFMEPCLEFGTVRCCGVAIRIVPEKESDRHLESSSSNLPSFSESNFMHDLRPIKNLNKALPQNILDVKEARRRRRKPALTNIPTNATVSEMFQGSANPGKSTLTKSMTTNSNFFKSSNTSSEETTSSGRVSFPFVSGTSKVTGQLQGIKITEINSGKESNGNVAFMTSSSNSGIKRPVFSRPKFGITEKNVEGHGESFGEGSRLSTSSNSEGDNKVDLNSTTIDLSPVTGQEVQNTGSSNHESQNSGESKVETSAGMKSSTLFKKFQPKNRPATVIQHISSNLIKSSSAEQNRSSVSSSSSTQKDQDVLSIHGGNGIRKNFSFLSSGNSNERNHSGRKNFTSTSSFGKNKGFAVISSMSNQPLQNSGGVSETESHNDFSAISSRTHADDSSVGQIGSITEILEGGIAEVISNGETKEPPTSITLQRLTLKRRPFQPKSQTTLPFTQGTTTEPSLLTRLNSTIPIRFESNSTPVKPKFTKRLRLRPITTEIPPNLPLIQTSELMSHAHVENVSGEQFQVQVLPPEPINSSPTLHNETELKTLFGSLNHLPEPGRVFPSTEQPSPIIIQSVETFTPKLETAPVIASSVEPTESQINSRPTHNIVSWTQEMSTNKSLMETTAFDRLSPTENWHKASIIEHSLTADGNHSHRQYEQEQSTVLPNRLEGRKPYHRAPPVRDQVNTDETLEINFKRQPTTNSDHVNEQFSSRVPVREYFHRVNLGHSGQDETGNSVMPTTTHAPWRKYVERLKPSKGYYGGHDTEENFITTTIPSIRKSLQRLFPSRGQSTFEQINSDSEVTTSTPPSIRKNLQRLFSSRVHTNSEKTNGDTEETVTISTPPSIRKSLQRLHSSRVLPTYDHVTGGTEELSTTTTRAPRRKLIRKLYPSKVNQGQSPTTTASPQRQNSQRLNPINVIDFERTSVTTRAPRRNQIQRLNLQRDHSSYGRVQQNVLTSTVPSIDDSAQPLYPTRGHSTNEHMEEDVLIKTGLTASRRLRPDRLHLSYAQKVDLERDFVSSTTSVPTNEHSTYSAYAPMKETAPTYTVSSYIETGTSSEKVPVSTTPAPAPVPEIQQLYAVPMSLQEIPGSSTTPAPVQEIPQFSAAPSPVSEPAYGNYAQSHDIDNHPELTTTLTPIRNFVQRKYLNRDHSTYESEVRPNAPSYSRRKSTTPTVSYTRVRGSSGIPTMPFPQVAKTPNSRRFKVPPRFVPLTTTTTDDDTVSTTMRTYVENSYEGLTDSGHVDNYDLILDKEVRGHLANTPYYNEPLYGQGHYTPPQSYYSDEDDEEKETLEEETRLHIKYEENTTPLSSIPLVTPVDTVNKQGIPKYKRIRIQKPLAPLPPSGSTSFTSNVNTNTSTTVVKSQVVGNLEESRDALYNKEHPEQKKRILVESKRFKAQLSPILPTSTVSTVSSGELSQPTRFSFPSFNSRTHSHSDHINSNTASINIRRQKYRSTTEPSLTSTQVSHFDQVETTENQPLSIQVQPTYFQVPSTTPMTSPPPQLYKVESELRFKPSSSSTNYKSERFSVPTTFKFKAGTKKLNTFHSIESEDDKEKIMENPKFGSGGNWNEDNAEKVQIEPIYNLNKEMATTFSNQEINPLSQWNSQNVQLSLSPVRESNGIPTMDQNKESNSDKIGNSKPILELGTQSPPNLVNQTPSGMTYININSLPPNGFQPNVNSHDNRPHFPTQILHLTNPGFEVHSNENQTSVVSLPKPTLQFTHFESPAPMSQLPFQFPSQTQSSLQPQPQPPPSPPQTRFHVPSTFMQNSRPVTSSNGVRFLGVSEPGQSRPGPIPSQGFNTLARPTLLNLNTNVQSPINPVQFRPLNNPSGQRPPMTQPHFATQYSPNQFNPYGQPAPPPGQHPTQISPHYVKEYHQHHALTQEILSKLQNTIRTSRSASLTESEIATLLEITAEKFQNSSNTNSTDLLKELELLTLEKFKPVGNLTDLRSEQKTELNDKLNLIPGEKVFVAGETGIIENKAQTKAVGSSDTENVNFNPPKTIERGFLPILPYSEKDPGITVVNLNTNSRTSRKLVDI